MDQVTAGTLSDLEGFLGSIAGADLPVKRDAMMTVVPEIGTRATSAATMLSATFFEELLELQGLPRKAGPVMPASPGLKPWYAMVGWALADPKKTTAIATGGALFMVLAGGVTRMMTEAAADTIAGNAAAQGGMRLQRMPQPGCCAWCGMLSTKRDYLSEESAERVVGRGAPVGSHILAKGTRPRYSRNLGQTFHDHCRCKLVALREGNSVDMGQQGIDWEDAYGEAAYDIQQDRELRWTEVVEDDGTKKRKYYWIDHEGTVLSPDLVTKRIVAKMRDNLGIR